VADRTPIVIANGRFQQQQVADTLAIPGPASTPSFYQVGEIATPATPASGFGRIYAKTDGKLYFLNDGGSETDLTATMAIGSTIGSATAGSVLFAGAAGVLAQDNANFFWDDTNNRLGIGTATPAQPLHVAGNARVDGDTTLGDAAGDTLTINGTAVTIPNNLNFDSNTLFIDAANNRVGIGTITPSQPLHVAGNARLAGDVVVTGNMTVEGTTTTIDSETVLIADNHLYLNNGYNTVAAQTGGLVVNYLPTATTTTVNAAYVAGVAATSNPTVGTVGAATFALADLIQISGSTSNDGLYEVLSHAANVLTIRGIGVTGTVEDFTQNQFVAGASDGATITKVNISVIRSGTDGLWEVGSGAVTPVTFTNLGTGSGNVTGTGSSGAVAFWSGTSSITEDPTQLFWDNTNNRLGIGTATPTQALDVAGNVRSTGFYETAEIAAPATPASGFGRIYAKTDGLLYFKNDAGTEFDLTSTVTSEMVITGQTTTGLADGDFGYVSAANTWSKSQSDGTATQATVISCNEGTASRMTLPGSVIENAKFTTAGGSPAVGATVWLAAAADDGATGAGKLTATAPTASGSYLVACGVCVDAANYAGSKTAKIIFSPAVPVLI
jgi:hypothetical protein